MIDPMDAGPWESFFSLLFFFFVFFCLLWHVLVRYYEEGRYLLGKKDT